MDSTVDCERKSNRKSRLGRRSGKTGKKRPSGKYGSNVNPFFNFLLCVKKKYKGSPAKVIVKKGAEMWNKLNCEEKQVFIKDAIKTVQVMGTKGGKRISSSSRNKYQSS